MSFLQKIMDDIALIFNTSELGQHYVFYPTLSAAAAPVFVSGKQNGNRGLARQEELFFSNSDIQELGAAGVNSTIDLTFDRIVDNDVVLITLVNKVVGRVIVTAGDTITLSAQSIISIVKQDTVIEELFNRTLSLAGITGNKNVVFLFDDSFPQKVTGKGWTLRWRIVVTATRTAGVGAANQAGLKFTSASEPNFTVLNLHVHPLPSHNYEQLFTRRL